RQLAPVEIREVRVFGFIEGVEENSLKRPQQIGSGEYHSGCGDDRQHRISSERRDQHEELSDESIGPGKSNAAERDEGEHGGEHRHNSRNSSVRLDQTRMPALVDNADEKEQRSG